MKERCKIIFEQIDESKEELIKLTTKISEIPAPPFQETKRANFIYEKFSEFEYDVKFDSIGNVIAHKNALSKEKLIIISAHIDTVFPEGTNVKVRRQGDLLYGPGVCDDSRGLAVLLFLSKLARRGINDENIGIVFVATLGEEGEGDLRGVKHLFTNAEHKELIKKTSAFITIDGIDNSVIVNEGIGSRRYKITYSGPGGHSFGAFGMVNPIYPLAKLVGEISKWKVPENPKTTFSVSVISGGRSVNSIPDESYILVDTRSSSDRQLHKMQNEIEKLSRAMLKEEENLREKELDVSVEIIGDRPPGKTSEKSFLVKAISKANQKLGYETILRMSSTDANIPMSLGIPAVSVASVHKAGRAHSLDEFIDAGEESLETIKRNYLMLEYIMVSLK